MTLFFLLQPYILKQNKNQIKYKITIKITLVWFGPGIEKIHLEFFNVGLYMCEV